MDIVERFLKYVSFDTQSAEDADTTPSTAKQLKLAEYLRDELTHIGMTEVEMDENGYVYATLPANTDKVVPTIGFISHMDTSPDCSGANIRPRIVKHYDGGDIVLDAEAGLVTSPSKFPELLDHVGEDIIVTDGHTLLGADDKAGIAEIVQAMVYLMEHPEIKHGRVRVGFNPDEEIGLGAHKFDVEKFGCEWGYTMDGGELGELEYENFNAASAKIEVKGVSVHPGYAKGKMINAARVAAEFAAQMPVTETPEQTFEFEGFYHLLGIEGNVEHATLSYIIRDHNRERFERRKQFVMKAAEWMNERYGSGVVTAVINDQYYNMREKIEPVPHVVDIVLAAMKECGIPSKVRAIRGGTDGAQLSFKGLPCPNIFAGGLNFHGPHEFLPIPSLQKASALVVKIIELTAQR
ncbi:MAG: peptidase T [Prevotella sp.]|nr:peptidase T [Prevotella sp.]MDY5666792.1 peptidase T [Alloprevotella sp.]